MAAAVAAGKPVVAGARLRLVAELLGILVDRPMWVLVMLIEGGQVLLVGKGIVGGAATGNRRAGSSCCWAP